MFPDEIFLIEFHFQISPSVLQLFSCAVGYSSLRTTPSAACTRKSEHPGVVCRNPMAIAMSVVPCPEESLQKRPSDTPGLRCSKMKPLLDQLRARRISFRQFAYLSKRLASKHQQPALMFSHVAATQWFNGKRNPTSIHRQSIATLLGISIEVVNGAFDFVAPELQSHTSEPTYAVIRIQGGSRSFEYPLSIKPQVDLSIPAVYEDQQWEEMFSVYPASLRRHLSRTKTKLCGWVPHDLFKPLIPYSRCLVLLKRSARVLSLDDSDGFSRRIWFIGLPSGNVDIRFLYRDGRHYVTSTPHNGEQRFRKDDLDPLGYVIGSVVFQLDVLAQQPN